MKMKLKANFIKDWHEYLKEILTNHWGFDVSQINDKDLPLAYFNAESRRIDQRKRNIEISDVFQCPPEVASGWSKIQAKIKNGCDITPHLSKLVDRIDSTDLMLNDWGIYHFHLGAELDGEFIKRTGPLLFAFVTDNCFYVINIYQHGEWTNSDIVEIIHRNWPSIIKHYIINHAKLAYYATDKERKILRSKHANSFVEVTDGTVYAPIGGGMVSSGHNVKSVIRIDKQHKFLKHLQNSLESELIKIRPDLEKQGYNGEPELIANLEITETEYRAVFPEYAFVAVLHKKA
ncbi:hypothetical protein E8K88_02660 [Lampropedia aestuarii]|uniref:Uncharacterized protein n=1 Tax=Lampropedia aestuarii TaxID=2562762 RepID=A0A4S5BTF6_9BURK|nr:hypothetical protein [Lampropedia aestuarii]THJ36184.1 hypothetical protein E8K88_02660 [Lampropedia aestuarii]